MGSNRTHINYLTKSILGRYYNGDIEGKFAFGIQSSTDASFFGIEESEPNYICYYADKEHLPEIRKGLATCEEKLGKNLAKIEKFFKENNGYNDQVLAEYLETTEAKTRELLEWYFRRELGNQILDCVKKEGTCNFDAEL